MTATRKNIMREFKIAELSCVDRPAQQHARAVLMKRRTDEETDMQFEKIASFATLDEAIAAIAKAEGCGRSDAMSRAAERYPALKDAYNATGRRARSEAASKALERFTPPTLRPGADEFEGAVHSIMQRDKCSRAAAMSRARAEHPEAYAALQQQA